MTFLEKERNGIKDLLLNDENTTILILLAKNLAKNVTSVSNGEDALDIVLTHGTDARTLLCKKMITKELLFKYLNKKHVQLDINLTKAVLISKTLDFWNLESNINKSHQIGQTENTPATNDIATAFAVWFFNKYNGDDLKETDFWPDANSHIRMVGDEATEDTASDDAKSTLTTLMTKKCNFGLFFNLNNSETGIQGRMDVHGMLLVLTCGTLHTSENCVGIFESLFGLLRDPFNSNNWKIKTIRCVLRSQRPSHMPTLQQSESLQEALTIPVDSND